MAATVTAVGSTPTDWVTRRNEPQISLPQQPCGYLLLVTDRTFDKALLSQFKGTFHVNEWVLSNSRRKPKLFHRRAGWSTFLTTVFGATLGSI